MIINISCEDLHTRPYNITPKIVFKMSVYVTTALVLEMIEYVEKCVYVRYTFYSLLILTRYQKLNSTLKEKLREGFQMHFCRCCVQGDTNAKTLNSVINNSPHKCRIGGCMRLSRSSQQLSCTYGWVCVFVSVNKISQKVFHQFNFILVEAFPETDPEMK